MDYQYLDRLTQKTERVGTSIFIRTYHGQSLIDTYEITNVPVIGSIPFEVSLIANRILTDLAFNTTRSETLQRSGVATHRPMGTDFAVSGTSVHATDYFVPHGGQWIDVSIGFINDLAASPMIVDNTAIAAGSSFGSLNPDAGFIVTGGLTVPNARVNGHSFGETPWTRVFCQPDGNFPKWGTISTRTRFTSGGRTLGSGPDVGYSNAAGFPRLNSKMIYGPLTNVTDPFVTPTLVDSGMRSSYLRIRTNGLTKAATFANVGDSRGAGEGDTSAYYGTFHRTADLMAGAGFPIGYENLSIAGSNTASFTDRLERRLSGNAMDVLHWQPGSSNNTDPWTASTVDACLAATAAAKALCDRLGVKFTTETMYASFVADTPEKVVQWRRLNSEVRRLYEHVVDFERSDLTLRADSNSPQLNPALGIADQKHRNAAGHEYSAGLYLPVLKRALRA